MIFKPEIIEYNHRSFW